MYTPNPLKTMYPARQHGRDYYDFFLFGDTSTPYRFSRLFEQMGFGFTDVPYSGDDIDRLRPFKSAASKTGDLWPGNQFAAHVRKLQIPDVLD